MGGHKTPDQANGCVASASAAPAPTATRYRAALVFSPWAQRMGTSSRSAQDIFR